MGRITTKLGLLVAAAVWTGAAGAAPTDHRWALLQPGQKAWFNCSVQQTHAEGVAPAPELASKIPLSFVFVIGDANPDPDGDTGHVGPYVNNDLYVYDDAAKKLVPQRQGFSSAAKNSWQNPLTNQPQVYSRFFDTPPAPPQPGVIQTKVTEEIDTETMDVHYKEEVFREVPRTDNYMIIPPLYYPFKPERLGYYTWEGTCERIAAITPKGDATTETQGSQSRVAASLNQRLTTPGRGGTGSGLAVTLLLAVGAGVGGAIWFARRQRAGANVSNGPKPQAPPEQKPVDYLD